MIYQFIILRSFVTCVKKKRLTELLLVQKLELSLENVVLHLPLTFLAVSVTFSRRVSHIVPALVADWCSYSFCCVNTVCLISWMQQGLSTHKPVLKLENVLKGL